jgi:heptaprenyl diphosphate synthase
MTSVRVSQMANKYMNYDMIHLHTELPDFPEGRVSLLYAVLSCQPATAPLKDLLPVVTSLVQMGLDTHDLVDNGAGADSPSKGLLSMRSQQLKVLAGDYFSSRFYHLLSKAGHIELVRLLSEAVCEINRLKMSLYTRMNHLRLEADDYIHFGERLKSELFLSFTGMMSGLFERHWPEIVKRFSRCEMLLQELKRVEKRTELAGSWGVWHILQEGSEEDREALRNRREDSGFVMTLLNKYGVADKLGNLLRHSALHLQSLVQRLQSDKLMRDVQPLIEPFLLAAEPHRTPALKELG